MLTPMNRSGGLPANLELRMADEGPPWEWGKALAKPFCAEGDLVKTS